MAIHFSTKDLGLDAGIWTVFEQSMGQIMGLFFNRPELDYKTFFFFEMSMHTILCVIAKMNNMICCMKNEVVNACSIDVLTWIV